MTTTYDEIYSEFISRCKVDDIDLPNTNEKIYTIIKGAVKDYNNRLRDNIICSDETESLSKTLNEDELLTIAHYLRANFLKNQLVFFSNTWEPFSKDLGRKNFNAQLKSMELLVKDAYESVETVIRNSSEDFM